MRNIVSSDRECAKEMDTDIPEQRFCCSGFIDVKMHFAWQDALPLLEEPHKTPSYTAEMADIVNPCILYTFKHPARIYIPAPPLHMRLIPQENLHPPVFC